MSKFPVVYDMDPNDPYYKSKVFKLEDLDENEKVEISADKPIQVRINNGPWIDVRQADLNNL